MQHNLFVLDMPFFQAHGEMDNILPLRYGENTSKKLKSFLKQHEVRNIYIFYYLSKIENEKFPEKEGSVIEIFYLLIYISICKSYHKYYSKIAA